jgi:hypothetical protein
MLTRYGRYWGNKIPTAGQNQQQLPCSEELVLQRLKEDNLHYKSPGPPGWGFGDRLTPCPSKNTIVRGPQKKLQIELEEQK